MVGINPAVEGFGVCVALTEDQIPSYAKTNDIDLVFVGPEVPLVNGLVDELQKVGVRAFGPSKLAAQLEGSKVFSKMMMRKYNIPTAKYESFNDYELAKEYLSKQKAPIVLKADGLAAGKGVIIANTLEEAQAELKEMMCNAKFNKAGSSVVIEEFLQGEEFSLMCFVSDRKVYPMEIAQDHKRAFDNDEGLNTGGMGVIAPNPYYTKTIEEKFIQNILNPTLKGIKAEKMNFVGIIFFGLMVANGEVYLLEYNMRMGDPETQAVLPLMKSDFLNVINSALNKDLKNIKIDWEDKSACCVVIAAGGYPVKYEKGNFISGLEKFDSNKSDNKIFFAGVKEENDKFYTNGGRVLNVVSIKDSLEKAIEEAYKNVKEISFKDNYYRKDIGTLYVPVKY